MYCGSPATLGLVLAFCTLAQSASSYLSEFVNPDFIAAKQFDIRTVGAETTIITWANDFAMKGPWTVTNSSVLPPSGNKHDYMSWISHAWPNCTVMNNVTLAEEDKWKLCPYVVRNEENPDTIKVNAASSNAFNDLADAVLYNSIASVITKINHDNYSRRAVSYLQAWFLDPDKKMNPNLNYAQMKRGPKGQTGGYGGVMELRGFVKIASGILILRASKNPFYTPSIDQGMISWCNQYIQWLGTSVQGLREGLSINYHASFYSAQLVALKLIVNDKKGAVETIDAFFSTKFVNQIDSKGDQPIEAATPQAQDHRLQNLAALITLAKLATVANPSSNYWNRTTSQGGTIQAALDFAISQISNRNDTGETRDLEPLVASVAATFGDPDKKYETFLYEVAPRYSLKPYFFWNQPLSAGPEEDRNRKKMTGRPRVNSAELERDFRGPEVLFSTLVLVTVVGVWL